MEVCRRLKSAPTTADIPIIMLTAKGDEVDKILGLELGADDYITKPFSVRELIARVKALLRRAAPQNEEEGILHVGGLTIDVGNYEAFRNGEKLSLTLKEFELLKLLVLSRGKVLTRDFLLDRIWGYEFYGETRTVDVHIRHIRQKLGDDAHYIETDPRRRLQVQRQAGEPSVSSRARCQSGPSCACVHAGDPGDKRLFALGRSQRRIDREPCLWLYGRLQAARRRGG